MFSLKHFITFSFFVIILSFRFFFFYQNQSRYEDGRYVTFETILFSEPKVFSNYQRVSANLASGEKVFVKIPKYPKFHYGDAVRISGALKHQLLKEKKVVLTMYFPKTEAVKNNNKFNDKTKNLLLAVPTFFRQKVIFLFERTLSPTFSSLLLGIVFGIKESMPEDFTDKLRQTGVLHVVAASGMNVAIVGSFLSSIFSVFLRRQVAIAGSIAGIIFYALLAGLEASIVRASIMGIIVFSAQVLGRQTMALYGLCLAGFIMLFINPAIIFDIGFQLSFAATLGLLYIKPLVEAKENVKNALGKSVVGESILTTISAQLTTMPILLANFGIYSFWSIIVNGLVLWTIPVIMIIGGIGAIAGLIFPLFGAFIIYFSMPLLMYFEKVVKLFFNIEAVLSIENLSWQIILGYYAVLMSLILLFRKKLY